LSHCKAVLPGSSENVPTGHSLDGQWPLRGHERGGGTFKGPCHVRSLASVWALTVSFLARALASPSQRPSVQDGPSLVASVSCGLGLSWRRTPPRAVLGPLAKCAPSYGGGGPARRRSKRGHSRAPKRRSLDEAVHSTRPSRRPLGPSQGSSQDGPSKRAVDKPSGAMARKAICADARISRRGRAGGPREAFRAEEALGTIPWRGPSPSHNALAATDSLHGPSHGPSYGALQGLFHGRRRPLAKDPGKGPRTVP